MPRRLGHVAHARSAGSGGRTRRTSRRWISSARSSSISCSVIDHASASHGAGAAVDAQVRVGAHRLADHRVAGEALVERPQVVVDAGGEAHALDRRLGRGPARRAGREQHALRRGLDDRHEHRLLADVQQPHQRRAAAAQDPVAGAAADAERPRRRHLDAQIDRRVSPGRGGSIAPEQVDVDQERVARDDLPHHALLLLRAGRAPGAAAGHDRGGHGAGGEAGGGQRGGLPGRERRVRRSAPAPACGSRRPGGRRPPRSSLPRLQGTAECRALRSRSAQHDARADARERRSRSAARPEHAVPVRRADAEAALVVLEVVAHVQLAQPRARRACAAGGGARGSGPCRRPGSRPGSRR